MFYISIPIILLISFIWALISLESELKNSKKKKKFYELKREEEIRLQD